MKNTLFLFLSLAIGIIAKGQQKNGIGKNMAKVNLSSFAFKGFNVQYERQISKRITFALGYGSVPKSTIAFQSQIQNSIDNEDVNIGDFKLGTSVITPEVRFYTGKKGAFRGFYLAPYARISTYDMEVPIAIDATPSRTALFNGKLNNVTGGLLLGSNFKLSKSLYLDWWIIGASIGSGKGNLVAAIALSPTEEAALREQLKNIDVPFTNIQSEVNSNGATVRTSGSMAGVRGLGINLGIRF